MTLTATTVRNGRKRNQRLDTVTRYTPSVVQTFGSPSVTTRPAAMGSASHDRVTGTAILASLGPGSPRLGRPIAASVQQLDCDNFLASFTEAGLSASGGTAHEALVNLQDTIATKYRIFSQHGESKLTRRLQGQFAVLRSYVRG